uniref:Uncharacterized protein n=1 Tax=Rhizophora mucronata TaxID=61149 RepID=A0A2P2JUI1_RHIMU
MKLTKVSKNHTFLKLFRIGESTFLFLALINAYLRTNRMQT